MKKEEFIGIIISSVFIFLFFLSIVNHLISNRDEANKLNQFCLDKNFTDYEYFQGTLRDEEIVYCLKIENDTLIKSRISKRGNNWYFVNML